MTDTDDRTNTSLPVTAEIGGEGGSYADPTAQVATRRGNLDRTDSQGDSDVASRPVRSESIAADAGDETPKYPDE